MMLKLFLCDADATAAANDTAPEDAAAAAASEVSATATTTATATPEPPPAVVAGLVAWEVGLLCFGFYAVWRIVRAERWFRGGGAAAAACTAVRGWGRGLWMGEAFVGVALAVVGTYLLTPVVFSALPHQNGLTERTLLAMTGQIAAVLVMARLIPKVNPRFAFTMGRWRELWRWRARDRDRGSDGTADYDFYAASAASGNGSEVGDGNDTSDGTVAANSPSGVRGARVWHPVPAAAAGMAAAFVVTKAQQWLDTFWQWLGGAPLGLHETQDVVRMISDGGGDIVFLLLAGVSAVALAPIVEELFFRGLIYPFLKERYGALLAMLVTGAFFGAVHMSLPAFLPLMVFGAFLCLAYERTGDIRAAIVIHAFFNLNTFLQIIVLRP